MIRSMAGTQPEFASFRALTTAHRSCVSSNSVTSMKENTGEGVLPQELQHLHWTVRNVLMALCLWTLIMLHLRLHMEEDEMTRWCLSMANPLRLEDWLWRSASPDLVTNCGCHVL